MEVENIEEIVTKYQFKIYKYTYQMVRCKETAEDITQEVFMKFYQLNNKKMYSISYLFKIAHNKCIDYLRKKKREKNFFIEYKKTAHKSLLENQRIENSYNYELEAILSNLTSYERSVLLLKSVNQLSYKEIANILNKSETALRKQFQRVKVKIEREINKRREAYDDEEISII